MLGDAFGAGIVHHFVKDQLALADAEHHRRHSHMERGMSPVRSEFIGLLTLKFNILAALINDNEKHVGNSTWRPNTRGDGYDSVPQDDLR